MFGCNGKWNFPEIHFLLTNIYSFDQEIILHSYFQFKSFPEKEREREREREREKREPRSEREREEEERAGDRRGARSSDERRDRPTSEKREPAIDEWRARRSRSSIALLVGRSHWSRLRSCFSCAISSSPPLHDLKLTGFDEFFCWVLFLQWISVELIHYLHVYSWGSVWKIGHVKHFL